MKKLKLNIEELSIESFDADGPERRRGTVAAAAGSTESYYNHNSYCCETWGLDSRCADSMETSPQQCGCWPVTQWEDTSC
jgi:hypothetical protein